MTNTLLTLLQTKLTNQKINNSKYGNGIINEIINIDLNEYGSWQISSLSKINFDNFGEKRFDLIYALKNNTITLINDTNNQIKNEILILVNELDNINKQHEIEYINQLAEEYKESKK